MTNMRKIKNKCANKRKGILTINTKKQANQTKTKLSLQGPQWSRHSVAPLKNPNSGFDWQFFFVLLVWFFGVAT